ncbi:MAG TPA: hypothetical protein VF550_17625, partial [Polyangia bacterium]
MRSVFLCVALVLLPAVALLSSPPSFAAKPAAKAKAANKAKAAPKASTKDASSSTSSSSSSASEGYKYETPSPAAPPVVDTPASPLAESKPASEATNPIVVAEKEPAKSEAPAADKPAATETPAPEVVEEPVLPVERLPLYVEHLGPSSYPGKLRGIYGGSMWLEPSFNGLQWPYMAKSGVGVSGSFWVDSGYETINRDIAGLANTTMWIQQGRAVLRVTPTYTDGQFFIQGQVELVGNQCQQAGSGSGSLCLTFGTFDTDDLWLRIGQWNLWDLKVGRFEAWELYHTGMGLDINTMERQGAFLAKTLAGANIQAAPTFYAVNHMHDRPSAGLGVGYLAFHAYPTDKLRFELLGELGTTDSSGQGYNYLGGRPAGILDLGWLKLKLGYEYERQTKAEQSINASTNTKSDYPYRKTTKGFGGSVQLVFDPYVEVGFNGAYESVLLIDENGNSDGKGSFTSKNVGGFGNLRLAKLWLLGVGANWTAQTDSFHNTAGSTPDYSAHLQGFLALQYMLKGQLFIKAVLGYARADFQDTNPEVAIWSNYMYSARVRLMYLF